MDARRMRVLVGAAFAALCLVGCGSQDTVPAHSQSEQKAIDDLKKMTPEQRIALIEKGPMPAAAKASQIKKIKDEAGIK